MLMLWTSRLGKQLQQIHPFWVELEVNRQPFSVTIINLLITPTGNIYYIATISLDLTQIHILSLSLTLSLSLSLSPSSFP